MSTTHPELPCFDAEWIPRDGRFYCFVGPHGSGKSTLMRSFAAIVQQEVGVEDWIGFSDTEGGNGFLSTMIHPAFIHERVPTDADIEHIYNARHVQVSRAKKRGEMCRRLGIVIDDCDDENEVFRKCKIFRKLISNMRHFGVFVFVAVQNISQLPPGVRSQIDFLFQLRAEGPEAVEDVYKRYLKGRMGIEGFKYRVPAEMDRLRTYLQRYTCVGHCLVISKASGAKYLSYLSWPQECETGRLGDEISAQVAAQAQDAMEKTPEEEEREYQLALKRLRENRFKESLF
jgi:energy-coupling factor transporter ATP-binding protein EcfA2